MTDKTKGQIIKWSLIGIGSLITAVGSMVKLKPVEEPTVTDDVEYEVTDAPEEETETKEET